MSAFVRHLNGVSSNPRIPAITSSGEKNLAVPDPTAVSHKDHSGETWVALCAKAAVEQDPRKLLELVSEINRLLDARKKRLSTDAERQTR
jgi:hypothetical protein